jgi:predicted nucleic acid-binding protein
MSAPVFVDTNVLLYAVDEAEPRKHGAAIEWRADLWRSRRGRVSYQVLQEFYVQALRKNPKRTAAARAEVRDLLAWDPIPVDGAVVEGAWHLQDRYRLSFWDALIVAAAHAAGCGYLLTEDLSHGQILDGVRVVSPFEVSPRALDGPPPGLRRGGEPGR